MPATHGFTTEDIAYLRHGDRALMLRVYKPVGAGPFPAVIDLHGGAWSKGTLEECKARDTVLAGKGIVAIGLDFRDGNDGYPSALVDINYAIRWVKANAARLGTRPDWVSLCGQSSGGHLAMLAAMRPDDARYAALKLPAGAPAVDGTVHSIVMTWPVINPRSRYYHLLRHRAAGTIPDQYKDIAERQTTFWKNDANMIDGNPMLILERGEKAVLPPTLWVQSRPDFMHDYRDDESPVDANEPERFVANYRKAGGRIELRDIGANEREALSTHELVADFILGLHRGMAAAQ
jgi:acetyl esterase/lipase